jgi:hypothetical protein
LLGFWGTGMSLRLPHPTPGAQDGFRGQRLHPTRSHFSAPKGLVSGSLGMILHADGQSAAVPCAHDVDWPPCLGCLLASLSAVSGVSRITARRPLQPSNRDGTRRVHRTMYPWRCATIAHLGNSRRKTRFCLCHAATSDKQIRKLASGLTFTAASFRASPFHSARVPLLPRKMSHGP